MGTNVSLEGIALTTNNSGGSWTAQSLPSGSLGPADIVRPSTTTCYVVGDNTSDSGDVLTTSNSGITWTTQPLPSGVGGLFGIACPSATCYAAGMKPSGGGGFVLEGPFSITTASLPDGTTDVAYSAGLTASGGTAPYAWSIIAGAFPAGLSLHASTGVISGTPTTAGSKTAAVEVTNAEGWKTSVQLSIAIANMTITTESLPGGTVGHSYSTTLVAIGGNPPYTWSVVKGSGSLPLGLRLKRSSGLIEGVPSRKRESSTFEVEVRDTRTRSKPHTRNTALAILSVMVSPAP